MGNNRRKKLKKSQREKTAWDARRKLIYNGFSCHMDPDWFVIYRAKKLKLI